jgi:phosphoesterase RecJ-like protein
MTLNDIAKKINDANNIAILPHISPDGDCVGSSFALSFLLKKIGKFSEVILEEDIPKSLSFLPGNYKIYDEDTDYKAFDTVICIDSGDEKRINKRKTIFNTARLTINLDHHITNTKYAQYNYVDSKASATGEIIYDLVKAIGVAFDNEIAINIYTAVVTDTGGFRYSNTSERTHRIVAELLQYGINIEKTNRIIFSTQTIAQLKLTAAVIDSIELYENGKIAVAIISGETMKSIGAMEDDADGLSNLPRNIEGVEIGVLFRETKEGIIRVNFRSNEYADVSKVAKTFGGGGHKKASGCTLDLNMDIAKSKIIDAARKVIQQKD